MRIRHYLFFFVNNSDREKSQFDNLSNNTPLYLNKKVGVYQMRTYKIFHIKKEYQPFVLGREKMLQEILGRDQVQSDIDNNEMTYVCEKINEDFVKQSLERKLSRLFEHKEKEPKKLVLEHPLKGSIRIKFDPYCVHVWCKGSHMLDLDLFAGLSDSSDCYMAFQQEEASFGWLKPIKIGSIHSFTEILDFV